MGRKMWGGRFGKPTDPAVERYTSSIAVDARLARHDVIGSIAHARMLGKRRIIPAAEAGRIVRGLERILRQIARGAFAPDPAAEDIHSEIESRLGVEPGWIEGRTGVRERRIAGPDESLVELAEEKGWDVDYFMCCLYYRTRNRDEYVKLLGSELPLGEIYLPSDPPRMFKVVQQTRKPCLVYKVLAAGRRIGNPSEVRRCFETALSNIKAGDALIVGMYQEFGDQVGENAAIVREICAARHSSPSR